MQTFVPAGMAVVRRRSRFLLFCAVALAAFFLGVLAAAATTPAPPPAVAQEGTSRSTVGFGGGGGGLPPTITPTGIAGAGIDSSANRPTIAPLLGLPTSIRDLEPSPGLNQTSGQPAGASPVLPTVAVAGVQVTTPSIAQTPATGLSVPTAVRVPTSALAAPADVPTPRAAVTAAVLPPPGSNAAGPGAIPSDPTPLPRNVPEATSAVRLSAPEPTLPARSASAPTVSVP
jgi:hypothetical protein